MQVECPWYQEIIFLSSGVRTFGPALWLFRLTASKSKSESRLCPLIVWQAVSVNKDCLLILGCWPVFRALPGSHTKKSSLLKGAFFFEGASLVIIALIDDEKASVF